MPGFVRVPTPVRSSVTAGEVAQFQCQHSNSQYHVGWKVNNVSLGSNSIPGVSDEFSPSIEGPTIHTLHINTSKTLGNITSFVVQCIAALTDDPQLVIMTDEVILKVIQGIVLNFITYDSVE